MRSTAILCLLLGTAPFTFAQPDESKRPPVIDIHVHTFGGIPGAPPMCPFNPQFLAADPKVQGPSIGWVKQDCTNALDVSKNPQEYMRDVIAEFERLNVTAVVMGDQKEVKKWKDAAPSRVIMGTSFDNDISSGKFMPAAELRKAFTGGGFKVMGEVGTQYQGIAPNDPSLDPYWALAEELDIPVGIHMGTGGSGRANIGLPKYRGSLSNPLLLEDVLAKHPKLRVWVMHGGYPMMESLLTLLGANAYVYVDVAGLIWSYPIKEVHGYIQRIVEAGFEDRLMFGTDQMVWPKLMSTCIQVIETAPYLTTQQKRDILYNNAARFLRLDTVEKK